MTDAAALARSEPCERCGQPTGPYRFLYGHQPCRCITGHATMYCREDAGGCGHTRYVPQRAEGCREVGIG